MSDKHEISLTLWRDEFENLIRSILPPAPGGSALAGKGVLFVDEVAKMAYRISRKLFEQQTGKKIAASLTKRERKRLDQIFANVYMYLIDETTIHELGHLRGLSQKQTIAASRKLMRKMLAEWMVWNLIPCPKRNNEPITWTECLKCTDDEKHESCPLWAIRQDFYPREREAHVFHISELTEPRFAYYNRTEGFTDWWDSSLDFFIGHGVHSYIQSKYPAQERELFCWWNLGDVKIIGYVDRVDIKTGTLYEYKTYATLKFLLERNEPEPAHVYQAQGYVELLKHSHPWIKITKVKVICIAKAKEPPQFRRGEPPSRYKEFTLDPNPPADLADRARALDAALEKRKPPNFRCPEWRCRNCPYAQKCKEDGFS